MSPRWWCSRCRENPRLTRSFQDVRRNDNQLSGDIWDNQHRVQMSARSKSLIIMAMMPAGGRRRWDNVQRIEHHLTEVALARQRGSRNFPLFIIFSSNPFHPRNINCLSIIMTINQYFHSNELPKYCKRQCLQSKERDSTKKSGEKGTAGRLGQALPPGVEGGDTGEKSDGKTCKSGRNTELENSQVCGAR